MQYSTTLCAKLGYSFSNGTAMDTPVFELLTTGSAGLLTYGDLGTTPRTWKRFLHPISSFAPSNSPGCAYLNYTSIQNRIENPGQEGIQNGAFHIRGRIWRIEISVCRSSIWVVVILFSFTYGYN